MNKTAKSLITAVVVAAFTFAGVAAPAGAAPKMDRGTVWCC